jgi:hypothetical protein
MSLTGLRMERLASEPEEIPGLTRLGELAVSSFMPYQDPERVKRSPDCQPEWGVPARLVDVPVQTAPGIGGLPTRRVPYVWLNAEYAPGALYRDAMAKVAEEKQEVSPYQELEFAFAFFELDEGLEHPLMDEGLLYEHLSDLRYAFSVTSKRALSEQGYTHEGWNDTDPSYQDVETHVEEGWQSQTAYKYSDARKPGTITINRNSRRHPERVKVLKESKHDFKEIVDGVMKGVHHYLTTGVSYKTTRHHRNGKLNIAIGETIDRFVRGSIDPFGWRIPFRGQVLMDKLDMHLAEYPNQPKEVKKLIKAWRRQIRREVAAAFDMAGQAHEMYNDMPTIDGVNSLRAHFKGIEAMDIELAESLERFESATIGPRAQRIARKIGRYPSDVQLLALPTEGNTLKLFRTREANDKPHIGPYAYRSGDTMECKAPLGTTPEQIGRSIYTFDEDLQASGFIGIFEMSGPHMVHSKQVIAVDLLKANAKLLAHVMHLEYGRTEKRPLLEYERPTMQEIFSARLAVPTVILAQCIEGKDPRFVGTLFEGHMIQLDRSRDRTKTLPRRKKLKPLAEIVEAERGDSLSLSEKEAYRGRVGVSTIAKEAGEVAIMGLALHRGNVYYFVNEADTDFEAYCMPPEDRAA